MARIYSDKKRKVYRPEITIEYESITQIPLILLTICRFGIKRVNCNLTTDKYTVGVIKMLIIPKYRLIRR
jgi:hypothetical protein